MANSGLHGPHALTVEAITDSVKGVGAGAYALGCVDANGSFVISYVGRSDADLAARLKQWTGGKYPQFKFGFLPTAKDAFLKECNLFHDFGETSLDNAVHPARPNNTSWTCPRCRALG